MKIEEIRAYWEERASGDSSAQSTTQDVYLREIEATALAKQLERCKRSSVIDLGCGDARTTVRLATLFPDSKFLAFDYADSMVSNSKATVAASGLTNIEVNCHDATQKLAVRDLDVVYTTRCLINLPSWEAQQTAIENICDALAPGGHYFMIENYIEGHNNFNELRQTYNMPPIPVRPHNVFFQRDRALKFLEDKFDVIEDVNISSTYYIVSRVIYSAICREQASEPDYFDAHHRLASQLPFLGDFGPVRLTCLRKRA